MSPALLNKIPEEVREHVKMLLSVTPTVRPDADQMTKVCIQAAIKQLLFVLMAFLIIISYSESRFLFLMTLVL